MVLGTARFEPRLCKDERTGVKEMKKFLNIRIFLPQIRKMCIQNCVIVRDCDFTCRERHCVKGNLIPYRSSAGKGVLKMELLRWCDR